ncbi:ankyrin repeat domain-containing protein [Frigidibacter oleivorans]|uniref:ankyrin repeat domain-containing protein n=1 Tax=Frigidibacter oleivorans TaxID=2487129 RepID=UPI000F8DF59B|nr:ankyrin repeat domain-containing protein [Frigidibacter oleivorans]
MLLRRLAIALIALAPGSAFAADCPICGPQSLIIDFTDIGPTRVETRFDPIVPWLDAGRGTGLILSQDDAFAFCNAVGHPVGDSELRRDVFNRMFDIYREKYQAGHVLDLYPGIRCSPGVSLLSTAVTYGNFEAAIEMYKMHVPLNTVNERGETELDYLVNVIGQIRDGRPGNLMWYRPFFRAFRGDRPNYDIPLMTCEVEGTCRCPFSLPEYGAECVPAQN